MQVNWSLGRPFIPGFVPGRSYSLIISSSGLYHSTVSKRLQVLLDPQENREIQGTARRQRMSVAEWVRQALRKARSDSPLAVEAKLRALAEASRYQFPTADIEVMLREIEAGQRLR